MSRMAAYKPLTVTPHGIKIFVEGKEADIPAECLFTPRPHDVPHHMPRRISACHDGLMISSVLPTMLPLYFPACTATTGAVINVPVPVGTTLLTYCWNEICNLGSSHDLHRSHVLSRAIPPWPMLVGCPDGMQMTCYDSITERFPYTLLPRILPNADRLSYQLDSSLHWPSRVIHLQPESADRVAYSVPTYLGARGVTFGDRPVLCDQSPFYPLSSLATRYRMYLPRACPPHASCLNPRCHTVDCLVLKTRAAMSFTYVSPYAP
jgi:hypothetical protein